MSNLRAQVSGSRARRKKLSSIVVLVLSQRLTRRMRLDPRDLSVSRCLTERTPVLSIGNLVNSLLLKVNKTRELHCWSHLRSLNKWKARPVHRVNSKATPPRCGSLAATLYFENASQSILLIHMIIHELLDCRSRLWSLKAVMSFSLRKARVNILESDKRPKFMAFKHHGRRVDKYTRSYGKNKKIV